ncbi:MAG: hypothetical protein IH865_00850 [Chloroflexi bacterium]|nr:hypothetical protein [Chloroflexota bacterium]
MTQIPAAPAASAPPEKHADWLELLALSSPDKNSSFQDLIKEFRHSGSVDALGEDDSVEKFTDKGSERSQLLAEEAFNEISDRHDACGIVASSYAFDISAQYIQARQQYDQSIYAFLLLLSKFGKDAGPDTIDLLDLFDKISGSAASEYMGGPTAGVQFYLFGFPRRVAPPGFRDALDDLCNRLGEGGGSKDGPTRKNQKDAKLDIAVWRAFNDGRVGKFIGFGQCATGEDWPKKLTELQPTNFIKKWMHKPLAVDPIRLFFTPHRVPYSGWEDDSIDGGVLFDRCRISALTRDLDDTLVRECRKWTRFVIRKHLK